MILLDFNKFIEELKSIENPPDRKVFLSMMIDRKMSSLEKKYVQKSINYLSKLRVEIREQDLASLAKSLVVIAQDQSKRLVMILDRLIEDQSNSL